MLRKTKGFEQITHKPFPVLNKRPQKAAIWFPVTAKTPGRIIEGSFQNDGAFIIERMCQGNRGVYPL
jgi:hypothetical protein